jgi:hypothetical protein
VTTKAFELKLNDVLFDLFSIGTKCIGVLVADFVTIEQISMKLLSQRVILMYKSGEYMMPWAAIRGRGHGDASIQSNANPAQPRPLYSDSPTYSTLICTYC